MNGKTPAIRDNARKEAADARGRIAELENTNTFQAAAVIEPIKSPLTGYERLAAFILWAASQACWFMAYGEAATEAGSAKIGAAQAPESEALPHPRPWGSGAAHVEDLHDAGAHARLAHNAGDRIGQVVHFAGAVRVQRQFTLEDHMVIIDPAH